VAAVVGPILDDGPPGLDAEVAAGPALGLLAQQESERGVGGLVRVAAQFALLDELDDPADQFAVGAEVLPSSLPFSSMEARPAMSETSIRMVLPTCSGSMYLASFT
jgi:hypothetical protein